MLQPLGYQRILQDLLAVSVVYPECILLVVLLLVVNVEQILIHSEMLLCVLLVWETLLAIPKLVEH